MRFLSKKQKDIMRVMLDRSNDAEYSREIALVLNTTEDSVNHQLEFIYLKYGVHSCRGLLKVYDEILKDLGITNGNK